MPLNPGEDLADFDIRLRAEALAREADQPKLAKHMSDAELSAFAAEHNLGPHRPFHGPVPMTRQPPNQVRANVWPKPPAVTEGTDAFGMSNDQLRAFEQAHGLRQSWR